MRILVIIFLAIFLPAIAMAGPLEDGNAAYAGKDYQTALKLWQPLADKGNAQAQFYIGCMYYYGQGVKQDNVQAYKWLLLAEATNEEPLHKTAYDQISTVKTKMLSKEIDEAKRLASEWRPTPARPAAADTAGAPLNIAVSPVLTTPPDADGGASFSSSSTFKPVTYNKKSDITVNDGSITSYPGTKP